MLRHLANAVRKSPTPKWARQFVAVDNAGSDAASDQPCEEDDDDDDCGPEGEGEEEAPASPDDLVEDQEAQTLPYTTASAAAAVHAAD
eukprot:7388738-Pyramimonas_sp.AAC.1